LEFTLPGRLVQDRVRKPMMHAASPLARSDLARRNLAQVPSFATIPTSKQRALPKPSTGSNDAATAIRSL